MSTQTELVQNQRGEHAAITVQWHWCTAAALSLVMPGSGQLYSGKTFAALIWLPAVICAYLASDTLGVAAHVICVLDATQRDFKESGLKHHADVRMSQAGTSVFGIMVMMLIAVFFAALGRDFLGR